MKKRYRQSILSVVIIVSIWQFVSMGVGKNLIFPTPITTFHALVDILSESSTLTAVSSSMFRVFFASLIALFSGFLLGFVMYFCSFSKVLFHPVLKIIQTTPVMSFIMLALLWLKADHVPIFVGFLMGLPIIASSILKGLESIDKQLIDMTDFFEVSWIKRLKFLYIPAVFPFLELAMKNALSLTWKVCVASEVLSYPRYAMGAELLNSKTLLETDRLFAWTFLLIVSAFIFEYLLINLLKLYRHKNPEKRRSEVGGKL